MQLDPNRRDGEGTSWSMGGRVEEKEGGSKAGRRKWGRRGRGKRGRQDEGGKEGRRTGGRAEEGRKGRPFEPGAAFDFQPDFKTIQVWSKI